MGFNFSIGGTTFDLVLASPTLQASIVSTKFFPVADSSNASDCDAVIELNDFTGTLFIRHTRNKPQDPAWANQERNQNENTVFQNEHEDFKSGEKSEESLYATSMVKKSTHKSEENIGKEKRTSKREFLKSMIGTSSRDSSAGIDFDRFDGDTYELDSKNENNRNKLNENVVASYLQKGWIRSQRSSSIHRKKTKLHQACGSPEVKVPLLHNILKANPDDAYTLDMEGNTPLHVIAQNGKLLLGASAISAQFFIEYLIKAYPGAVIDSNDAGFFPFTKSISNWIEEVHEECRLNINTFSYEEEKKDIQIPKTVDVNQLVVLSFKFLSDIFFRLDNTDVDIEKLGSMTQLQNPSEKFVHYISNIPLLIKTTLLIDKDKLRQRIFDFHYIKRCFLMDHTVGDWIVILLANKDTSSRVIEYFEYLTRLTPSEALGLIKPQITDITKFRSKLENIISKIAKMEYILPALFMLNENDVNRACHTYPVRRILDLSMTDPSLLGLLTFDLSVHVLLILCYDAQEDLLFYTNADVFDETNILKSPVMMSSLICVYMFVRKEVLHYFLVKSIRKTLKRYKSSWDLVRLVTIILVLVTNAFILTVGQATPFLLIFLSKSLTWIILLGFIKGTNLKLSMFIASLERIVYDMNWFLIVMSMTLLLFGDMMHMIIYSEFTDECNAIDLNEQRDAFADFCSNTLLRSFLRLFASLAGDAGLDDYWSLGSVPLILLWMLFMITGVIILLNVLIAIVNDSYKNSLSERHSHHAMARIPILAMHSYLDTEARKLSQRLYGNFKYNITIVGLFVCFFLFGVSFVAAVRSMNLGILKSTNINPITGHISLILLTFCYIVANVALFVTVTDWLHIDIEYSCHGKDFFHLIMKPVKAVIFSLLGVKDDKEYFNENEENFTKDDVLVNIKEMIDISINRVRADIRNLKSELQKHSSVDSSKMLSSEITEF